MRKGRAAPAIRELVGVVFLLLNINLTEHQHQTRRLCARDGSRQKRDRDIIILEHLWNMNIAQAVKWTKCLPSWLILAIATSLPISFTLLFSPR